MKGLWFPTPAGHGNRPPGLPHAWSPAGRDQEAGPAGGPAARILASAGRDLDEARGPDPSGQPARHARTRPRGGKLMDASMQALIDRAVFDVWGYYEEGPFTVVLIEDGRTIQVYRWISNSPCLQGTFSSAVKAQPGPVDSGSNTLVD